jgi:5-methyltetrahydropteroyltriglutamate--homocysteine methyltransferase
MSIATERKRRILTTHVGSLPRPADLSELMVARMDGRSVDTAKYAGAVTKAVADCVAYQLDTGIDIISDGEQSKSSFSTYVHQRLGGIGRREGSPEGRVHTKEIDAFPDFYTAGHSGTLPPGFECVAPMTYAGGDLLKADLDNLKAAIAGRNPVDMFIPAASVATVEGAVIDRHYNNEDAYLAAIVEAMRVEYEGIVAAGFSVQLDDPRLAMHYMLNPEMTVKQAQAWARRRVEAMNESVKNIPSNRLRHHTCYGINIGPRTHDFEMKHLTDIILAIKADYYSFEYGNPRHEHEWRIWEGVKLPEGKALLPGVVTHASVLVEHPELVAERILKFASVVGKEQVIASTDCGFASTPRAVPEVLPSIVTAKLQSLVEGAKIASKQLFG